VIKQIISTLVALLIFAALIRLYARYKEARAKKAAQRAQRLAAEVEPFYQEYLRHLGALREKHDPAHRWPQFPLKETGLPQAYRDDIDALTKNYSGVLAVKFGDSVLAK
jgi:hypothetical protein